ncbi:hypothetical protein SNEBB_000842 [Seison nebaliae]|nr:hypothetical protein SNEBB_000842 [Seison nebaliae]
MAFEDGQNVWVPDVDDGYILGHIVDIGASTFTIRSINNPEKMIQASIDQVYPTEQYDHDVDDNCALMFLNEANLLNNIRRRYKRDAIYTYVANILLAINPYKDLKNLYSKETVHKYKGKSLGVLPPHVFAIADKSYRDMRALKISQSIIVSGESGAGKTESTKYIIRFLMENCGDHSGCIEKRIVESNPLLESFGNAKTARNNNSSRFGKFIEIHFDKKFSVNGGFISHYLLEKSRICMQSPDERNYHIFYRLIAGAQMDLRKKLHLTTPDDFYYLNSGCTQYFMNGSNKIDKDRTSINFQKYGSLRDTQMNDFTDFWECDSAMSQVGLTADTKFLIYRTIAAILHLGNIQFDESDDSKDGSRIVDNSKESLELTAQMIDVSIDELKSRLIYRTISSGGTEIQVPLKVHEAQNARDALAKAIYSRLFNYLVDIVNKSIPYDVSNSFIGILDIAGFEFFQINSFEQFCINYCNEKLQQFFNERILKEEQALYAKEGLNVKKIHYIDNEDCIDLIENRIKGVFHLLDEESKLPACRPDHFTSEVHLRNRGHFRIDFPRKSRLKCYRGLRDDEGFLIRHFAGAVVYQTHQFIEKNNDALHQSLLSLIQKSNDDFIQKLFNDNDDKKLTSTYTNTFMTSPEKSLKIGRLGFISIGSKFRSQLALLMEKLKTTRTSFVRCVKPNSKMASNVFDGGPVLSQLQCSGMTSVVSLMQQGFPSRTQFRELYEMYKKFMPKKMIKLDPRLFCKALFHALGLNENDYKFGISKVFFRPGKFAEFDKMLQTDSEEILRLVDAVGKWLRCSRWKRAQWGALSVIKLKNKIIYRRNCIVKLQSEFRGYLVRRRYKERIRMMREIRILINRDDEMRKLLKELDETIRLKLLMRLNLSQKKLMEIENKVKSVNDKQFHHEEIDESLLKFRKEINENFNEIKETLEKENIRKKEERERLQILAMEMEQEKEKQRRLKEEEEEKRKDEQMRQEIEERRKKVEEESRRIEIERQKKEEKQLKLKEQEKFKKEEEDIECQKEIEQSKRDLEMSNRLKNEYRIEMDDQQVTGITSPSSSSAPVATIVVTKDGKYDLSKFKYAELRVTINNSCDIDLIKACRREFHRRLHVYHAWKTKHRRNSLAARNSLTSSSIVNQSSNDLSQYDENELTRAPSLLLKDTSQINIDLKAEDDSQRYFRLSHTTNDSVWYGHFDGEWIARQMDVFVEGKRPARLLVAGVDDMSMLEQNLSSTSLTKIPGTEILPSVFEATWTHNGGYNYLSENFSNISSRYVIRIMKERQQNLRK